MTKFVTPIRRGERLTGGANGSLNRAANELNSLLARTDIRAIDSTQRFSPVGGRMFLARITEWEAIDGNANRWRYAWEEITIDKDDAAQLRDSNKHGTLTTDYALNLVELNNTDADGPQGNSVDTSGQLFTDNALLELQPVGGGTGGTPDVEVVVFMTVIETGGAKRFVFQYENAIDGECAE